LDSTLLLFDVA